MSDAPDFQRTVVLNSTPSFVMLTADSPDWQETVQLVNSAQSDCPDWQQYIVGPGGTPITPVPPRGTISAVGGAQWSDSNNGVITLSVNPVTIGDILFLGVDLRRPTPGPITGVSGGGVTTWDEAFMNGLPLTYENTGIWWGIVISTGPSVISLLGTGSPAASCLTCQEFTAGAGTTWSVYGNTGYGVSYTSTSLSWSTPALTPQGSEEMYLAIVGNAYNGMTMPGFPGTGNFANGGSYPGIDMMGWTIGAANPNSYSYICDPYPGSPTIFQEAAVLVYAT